MTLWTGNTENFGLDEEKKTSRKFGKLISQMQNETTTANIKNVYFVWLLVVWLFAVVLKISLIIGVFVCDSRPNDLNMPIKIGRWTVHAYKQNQKKFI